MLLAAILASLMPPLAQCQRTTTSNDFGWYVFNGDHRFTDSWGAHTEFQWRRRHIVTDPQQMLLRLGANYHAGKRTMLTVGYALVESYSGGHYFPEQRLYEQVQLSDSIGRLAITHRYRLEQRWDEFPGTSQYLYFNRVHYMLRGTLPLKGHALDPREPYISAYDTIYIGFGNNVPNIFDQNRLYAGLGYKLNREASLEAGYLYQISEQRNQSAFQHNHIVQIGFSYNFDFREPLRRH
jgi:hypothetical protein